MEYRRCGNSGLQVSAITLGLMVRDCTPGEPFESVRQTVLHALDRGITSIDLATGYGGGSVEQAVGKILRDDIGTRRDGLVLATKAGWADGSRKTLISSLERSLRQLGIDYVDLFYHHAPDPQTPLEETVSALDSLVRQGKALYVGISNYSAAETERIVPLLRQAGTPCVLHQANYNMLNRWVEDELLDTLPRHGMGAAVFSALAQGLLSGRSLDGPATRSRAAGTLNAMVAGVESGERAYGKYPTSDVESHVRSMLQELTAIARERGQTLSQLAVAWVLRHSVVSTVIVGTSNVKQLEDTIGAVDDLAFTPEELKRIEAIIPPRF
jgi:L-glyceraldehyde 3-phosphate reductase